MLGQDLVDVDLLLPSGDELLAAALGNPGAEPGGGGYVAQRIFSAKDERHGVLATLWFNVAHYALRPWPWILTALASLILYPDLVDKETGYIRTLMDPNVFPTYLRGFMLAAFAAALLGLCGSHFAVRRHLHV